MKSKLFVIPIILLLSFNLLAYNNDIVIIINKDREVPSISKEDAKNIFSGRVHKLEDGKTILPVERKTGKLKERFHRVVTNKGLDELIKLWAKLVFTGRAGKPREFEKDQEVIEWVKNNPNSIGYIHRNSVNGKKVKVVHTVREK